jgi:hypothetical protein
MRNPWTLGLIGAFLAVFFANGVMVWFALDGSPDIVPSYEAEAR